jgi:outer membrane murein-binding lipoprotein Lpp
VEVEMKRTVGLLAVICSLLVAGCISTAPFDQRAYETAVDLKVDSLVLVEQSVEPYTNHVKEAQTILLRVRKAQEYAKGIPDNDKTVAQWALVADPEGGGIAGYIKDWKEVGQFEEFEVDESKAMIESQFDAIIRLESAKLKK